MKEKVGTCKICDREVFCENGFLNAVIEKDHTLVCFPCEEKRDKEDEK